MISSHSPARPPPARRYLDLLPLFSLRPIEPSPPPCPVLSSSPAISLSSTPASFSRQFQISAKAAARRLDAYCCYRNHPCAPDHNVTLSPRQGSCACSFSCLTRCTPARLLSSFWVCVKGCCSSVCFLVTGAA